MVSIVMYHYVREIRRSRFPGIKGLETDDFRAQISFVKKHYRIIGAEELINAVTTDAWDELPANAMLLTFDDGYLDHFADVLPVLERERLPACFFPPAEAVLDHRVLDVNKIHFVLASVSDPKALVEHIFHALETARVKYQLKSPSEYWSHIAVANRFDPKEVVFVKRMLQRELPEELRRDIVHSLFARHVTTDETAFASELYMTLDQLRAMHDMGMYIGCHGYSHCFLDRVSPDIQRREVDRSLEFLRQVGTPTTRWIMCYPYGAHDQSLRSILRTADCAVGLTTEVGTQRGRPLDPLMLPRLDTNDVATTSHGGSP